MKITGIIGSSLVILACSHANTSDVKGPGHATSFDASAGFWKNTSEIETEDNPSQYKRCLARMDGMNAERAKIRCEDFVTAGQPDTQKPEPFPYYYGGYGYNYGGRR
jgi:hypothetical protein